MFWMYERRKRIICEAVWYLKRRKRIICKTVKIYGKDKKNNMQDC